MNKEEKRLSKYLGKILSNKPLPEDEFFWELFIENLTQDVLEENQMKTIRIQDATIVIDKIVGWVESKNYEDLVIYTLSENFEFHLGDHFDSIIEYLKRHIREN